MMPLPNREDLGRIPVLRKNTRDVVLFAKVKIETGMHSLNTITGDKETAIVERRRRVTAEANEGDLRPDDLVLEVRSQHPDPDRYVHLGQLGSSLAAIPAAIRRRRRTALQPRRKSGLHHPGRTLRSKPGLHDGVVWLTGAQLPPQAAHAGGGSRIARLDSESIFRNHVVVGWLVRIT